MSDKEIVMSQINALAEKLLTADVDGLLTFKWIGDVVGQREIDSITRDNVNITIALHKLNSACSDGEFKYMFSDRPESYINAHSVIAVFNGASHEQAEAYGKWKDSQESLPAHRRGGEYDTDWK